MFLDPFQPGNLSTIAISVTNSAAFTVVPGNGGAFELWNSDPTNAVFVEATNGTITAVVPTSTAGSYPIGAGQRVVIQARPGDTGLSCIASVAGPTNLFVARGNGS
jgi:hypothetical protein